MYLRLPEPQHSQPVPGVILPGSEGTLEPLVPSEQDKL